MPFRPLCNANQCKLIVNIKKQVNIQCKYVCIKLVYACKENWQYALTMQVPLGDPHCTNLKHFYFIFQSKASWNVFHHVGSLGLIWLLVHPVEPLGGHAKGNEYQWLFCICCPICHLSPPKYSALHHNIPSGCPGIWTIPGHQVCTV